MTTADHMMVRPMKPADATAVIEMARELAASVGDAAPAVPESDLIRLGSGPERWFDCLVAEIGLVFGARLRAFAETSFLPILLGACGA